MGDRTGLARVSAVPGAAAVLAAAFLAGCGLAEAPILDPKGPVALAERDILFRAFGIMMIVVVPVFLMTALFAWRFRASRPRGRYERDWSSAGVDWVTWIVPAAIVVSVGVHVWIFTHRLDPYKPLAGDAAPLEVQVVAQDWKWLFLYPAERVAAVNELAFPAGRPLSLTITSDTVMNSFFIPALGGQIYAMAGMQTRLHLAADGPGRFTGRNTQYSGDGFPDQHFAAVAMTDADFDDWVAGAREATPLDRAAYAALARPSIAHPVTYFSDPDPELFAAIVSKYRHAVKPPERAQGRVQ